MKSTYDALNQAMVEWKAVDETREPARATSLRNNVWALAYELYYEKYAQKPVSHWAGDNWVMDTILKSMEEYDPAIGHFSGYLKEKLDFREKDQWRKVQREKQRSVQDDPDQILAVLEDQHAEDPFSNMEFQDLFEELLVMILNFKMRQSGHGNNESRLKWYRIFFTEDMTLTMKHSPHILRRERDTINAMDLEYLDYYMEQVCRTQMQVRRSPMKMYCQVVPSRKECEGEVPLPIPADVSLSYLEKRENRRFSAGTRSNQKKVYEEEKRSIRQ